MHEILSRLFSYVRDTWKYRWYAVAIAWLLATGGWIWVFLLPDRYDASARVYVDTQSILKPLLSGLAIQPNTEMQIVMMSRTLMSRPNMERVMRMADMDIKLKNSEEKEALIDRLSRDISLRGAGDNLYTITYRDNRPEDAKRVVQALLTIFVEGSLGDKRKDSDSAKRFIDEQIRAYEQKLVVAENSLRDFKREHMGMMPGSGGDYLARVQGAAARLSQAKLELSEAENSRDALKKQLAGEDPVLFADEPAGTGPGSAAASVSANPELDSRIQALKQKLDALRISFTELHPDIISAKRMLARLEEQRAQEEQKKQEADRKRAEEQKGKKPAPVRAVTPTNNPVVQQLSISLAEAEATVAGLTIRVAEYERQHEELKKAVFAVPQVETDLSQLNRDYEINRRNYETLLGRRESAQMGSEMEANSGVLDFRIIDPPRVPLTPSAPRRAYLSSVVLFMGLAAGLAVAFLLGQIRPTFNDRRSLQEATGLPILGMVSMKWTPKQNRRRRRGLLAVAFSFLSLLGSYGMVMALLMYTGRA